MPDPQNAVLGNRHRLNKIEGLLEHPILGLMSLVVSVHVAEQRLLIAIRSGVAVPMSVYVLPERPGVP